MNKPFFLHIFLFLFVTTYAQNNDIFKGGSYAGCDYLCYSQSSSILNNSIFSGGNFAGNDFVCFAQTDAVLNNSIFYGGNYNGSDQYCITQADAILNNNIYFGGNYSGNDRLCYLQDDPVLNNLIFYGGSYAGVNLYCLGTITETPLPVTMLHFKGQFLDKRSVLLQWSTASEINTSHFDVQRSSDLKTWKIIGTVSAKGNSRDINQYNLIDNEPSLSSNYYRLKIIDFDNAFSFSHIVSIFLESEVFVVDFYPNPATNEVKILSNHDITEAVFFNQLGQIIFSVKELKKNSIIQLTDFEPGLYFVKVHSFNGQIITKPLVVVK